MDSITQLLPVTKEGHYYISFVVTDLKNDAPYPNAHNGGCLWGGMTL
jgi:hypothetical protein